MSSATFNSPNDKGLLLWKQGLWRNQIWQLIFLLTLFSFYHQVQFCKAKNWNYTVLRGQHRVLVATLRIQITLFSHGVKAFVVNKPFIGLSNLCKGSMYLWLETFRIKWDMVWLVNILSNWWINIMDYGQCFIVLFDNCQILMR